MLSNLCPWCCFFSRWHPLTVWVTWQWSEDGCSWQHSVTMTDRVHPACLDGKPASSSYIMRKTWPPSLFLQLLSNHCKESRGNVYINVQLCAMQNHSSVHKALNLQTYTFTIEVIAKYCNTERCQLYFWLGCDLCMSLELAVFK